MIRARIIREDDDPIAEARISLGVPREAPDDFYLVFRGNPDKVIALLETALMTREALATGMYIDQRS